MRSFTRGSATDRKVVVIEVDGKRLSVVQMLPDGSSQRSKKELSNEAEAVAALPEVLLVMEAGKSAGTKARKVGVAATPKPGPAKTVLAVCVSSCGASVPLEVTGELETTGLKTIPSPVIPTLLTLPEPVGTFQVNMVRTSVMEDIAVLLVTTRAMGIVVEVKPVVFVAGAQLFAASRYT